MILNARNDLEALRGTPDFAEALRLILGSTKTWINMAEPEDAPDWQEVPVLDTLDRMEFTMEEFLDELAAAGISATTAPAPIIQPPTQESYVSAIQAHVDEAARSKGYENGFSLAGYVASTNPGWSAEASVFIAWRDSVWEYAYSQMSSIAAGLRPQPTIAGLVKELPVISWPT